ncbi:cytochrome P450 [Azospirillum argentinense]
MTPATIRYNPYLPGFTADPYGQYRALRENDPVHRSFMGTWVLTRYRDVTRVLKDATFSSEPRRWDGFRRRYRERGAVAWLLERSVLNTDPPHHTRLKKAMASAFDVSERPGLAEILGRLAAEQIERIAAARGIVDAVADFALPVPVRAVSHLYRLSQGEQDLVKRWSVDVSGLIEPLPTGLALDDAERSIAAFREWLERRMEGGGDDSLPCRVARLLERGEMEREDALANLILMFPAGHETTVNLIGNGLLSLLRHPGQLARLRADPALMDSAIEEILRFEPPQQLAWRTALEDCEIGGKTIRRGEQVMMLLGAANRDPEVFDDPERFDIGRKPNPHLSFGSSRHTCLGAWFARLQGRIALSAFLSAFPAIRLAGQPEWYPTMSFHGLKSLPVRLDGDAAVPARRLPCFAGVSDAAPAAGPATGSVIVYGDSGGSVYLLDSGTGATIATNTLLYGTLTAPALAAVGYAFAGEGGTQGTTQLHAYSLATGADAWANPPIQLSGSIDATPVLIGSTLYVVTSSGLLSGWNVATVTAPQAALTFQAFTAAPGVTAPALFAVGSTVLVIATTTTSLAVTLGSTTQVAWTATAAITTPPLLVGTTYVAGCGTAVQAWNLSALAGGGSASSLWTATVSSAVCGLFDAGFGQVLAVTTDGHLTLLGADGSTVGTVSSAGVTPTPAMLALDGCELFGPRTGGGVGCTAFVAAASQSAYNSQWQAGATVALAGAPVATRGAVYAVTSANTVFSFARGDGAQQWMAALAAGKAPSGPRMPLTVAPTVPASQVKAWSQPRFLGSSATLSGDVSPLTIADIASVVMGAGFPYVLPYGQPGYSGVMAPLVATSPDTSAAQAPQSAKLYSQASIGTIATGQGISMTTSTDLAWMNAVSQPVQWFVTDPTDLVIGLNVAMLDFDNASTALARRMAPAVGIGGSGTPVGAGIQVALAMAGSTAQGLIQPYPGDLDFMERINIPATSRAAALAILAPLVSNRVLTSTTVSGIDIQFIEVKFGVFPPNFTLTQGGQAIQGPISWSYAQVQAGRIDGYDTTTGQAATVTWTQASAAPTWIKIDWILCDSASQTVLNTSVVLDPTWQAPDGTVVALDTGEEAFLQEVYLCNDSSTLWNQTLPLLESLYAEAGARRLAAYIAAMKAEVKKFTKPGAKQNFGKAAKRLYNLLRIDGQFLDAAYVRDMFSGGYFQLYQFWSQLKGIGEAATETTLSTSVMATQVGRMVSTVESASYLTSAQQQQLGALLTTVQTDLGVTPLPGSFGSDVAAAQSALLSLMNATFSAQLNAVPAIAWYLSNLSATAAPNALVDAVDDRFPS